MEETRVFIVTSFGGQYEDRWEHIYGVSSTYDKALQWAKDVCDMYTIDESKLPMTWDEYCQFNYGYPDYPEDGYDYNDEELCEYYNTLIDRDGHTISEFMEMENAEHLMHEDFSYCSIDSYLINNAKEDFDRKHVTVFKDADTKEYIIR